MAMRLGICRVALTTEAAPKLLAAGALLAADFVESGLAQGDAVLLARLIAMMTEPLATMLSAPQVCSGSKFAFPVPPALQSTLCLLAIGRSFEECVQSGLPDGFLDPCIPQAREYLRACQTAGVEFVMQHLSAIESDGWEQPLSQPKLWLPQHVGGESW